MTWETQLEERYRQKLVEMHEAGYEQWTGTGEVPAGCFRSLKIGTDGGWRIDWLQKVSFERHLAAIRR